MSLKFKLKFSEELLMFFQIYIDSGTERENQTFPLKIKQNQNSSMIKLFIYFIVPLASKTHFHYTKLSE